MAMLVFVAAAPASAQPVGGMSISVSADNGTVPLGGAAITVQTTAGAVVARQTTDANGRASIAGVGAGRYRVAVTLEGFDTVEKTVMVAAATTELAIDMPIAPVRASIEVTAPALVAGGGATIGTSEAVKSRETDQFTPGGGFASALRLLPSVIPTPAGLSIKGGRADQAGTQIGASTIINPDTNVASLVLPPDAIDSVGVMPNPYAVEFGRFSSGLVVLDTRRAGDRWHLSLNNVDPGFRTKRYEDYKFTGLGVWAPRVEAGGPILKRRVFVEESAQFRYQANDVPSRPENELRKTIWFSTFTRLDGAPTPTFSWTATGGVFPSRIDEFGLGTFTPPDATVDTHERVSHGSLTGRSIRGSALLFESTVRAQQDHVQIAPLGDATMEIQPETTAGSFYNRDTHTASTMQWVSTVSGARQGPGGEHSLKAGVDLLRSTYEGASASAPVLIERSDGSLARSLVFGPPATQQASALDSAFYVQDRLQPAQRWYLEFGARADRDGVLGRWNATSRAGVALMLDDAGHSIVRGGFGVFYDRTPLIADAFTQFESPIDTRLDATEAVTSVVQDRYARAPDLQTARSAVWNVSFERQVSKSFSAHLDLLDRNSTNELVVSPATASATEVNWLLTSSGRAVYRDVEAGFHWQRTRIDINAAYTHAFARSNLNTLTSFFGVLRSPVIGADSYAPVDVPDRVLVRGRLMPRRWLLLGLADWRTGFPHSIVNEDLDFVGARNVYRFPTTLRVELGLDRMFRVKKSAFWIGVRVNNAFNAFLPADVQANVGSPAFGTFYNSEIRQFHALVRFGL
ncbi:MAG TPA: TonB-dependent receptor [Vicinamibacterales bacterium]|jgi:hypothetical protein|nr:TonB-dependent receptor [Vicinamibacterales bacterium]